MIKSAHPLIRVTFLQRLIHPHRALITEGVAHIKKKKDVSDAGTTVKKGFKGLKSVRFMVHAKPLVLVHDKSHLVIRFTADEDGDGRKCT